MSEVGPTAYCTRCGAEMSPGERSCAACGAPVLGAGGAGGVGAAVVSSGAVPAGDAQGPPRRALRIGVLALVLVLAVGFGVYLATGSGDDHKTSLETSPSTRTASCKSVANGYAVEYPAAWYVEKADPAWSCALFDPHRFTLEPDTEAPMVAVTIYTERTISFDATVTGMTDPSSYKVLERRDTTVDGRRAVVLETVQLADQLLPAGTYSYQYVVDRSGGVVLVVTTGEPGSTYDQFRNVLDDMVASLRFGG